MLRGKYLPTLRFFLIAVKLIKENPHYIFAIPIIGINRMGNINHAINKRIDVILVFHDIHSNFAIYFKQNINFKILPAMFLQ